MTNSAQTSLAHVTVKGTIWMYAAFYSGKLIVFLSTVVLARILSKNDFGVVGYVVTIISFLDIVKDLGIGSALIYHRKEERSASTAFWLGLGVSVSICIIVWWLAPFIGSFFNDDRATWVTRLLSLNYPISALGGTQETLLVRDLAFNRKFIPDFTQALSKGIVSIALALLGFGPWSLIVGQLVGTLASVVAVWWIIPWRPAFEISRRIAAALLRFGIPMVGVNGIGAFVLNIDYLLVGHYLGPVELGIYTLAFRIPELVILEFCSIVANVIFPVLTKINDDIDALRRGFLQTARYVALITVPLGLGMALLADAFIRAFFSDKWLDAVPIMRAISIYALLLSLGYNAGDVYKAQGAPGVLTRISFLKACILAPGLLWAVTVPATLIAVGWVQIIVAFLGSVLNLVVALNMLHLSPRHILNSLKPSFGGGLGMSLVVLIFLFTVGAVMPPWLQLLAGTLIGGSVYLGVLWYFERPLLKDTLSLFSVVLLRK